MAVPATLAQIHVTPELLLRRVIGGLRDHPLELTEIRADHRRDSGDARRRFDEGEHALSDDGEKEKAYARHQSDKPRAECFQASGLGSGRGSTDIVRHSAGPPAGTGIAPGGSRGSAATTGLVNAVIMRFTTSRVMPMSMLMPESVRTSQ